MTYEQVAQRLVALARENGGVLTAAQAEHDPKLAAAKRPPNTRIERFRNRVRRTRL